MTVSGGTPTLTLNDGGTATYASGSGTNALTFSYTVGAGQNTADLAISAVNANAATITDGAGNTADLSSAVTNPAGTLQIGTITPTVSSVMVSGAGITNGTGDLNAGDVITLTVNLGEAVTVSGGTPTLTLNDGGVATYTGGSGSSALTFSYTVGAGQNTSDLAINAVNANAATIIDRAGNAADLSGAVTNPVGTLQIDTTTPTVSSVVASGNGITNGTGDLNAGDVVTLTLNMSEAVRVSGTPTLTLNDGGTATFTGGSGTNALTFSYTVAAGQNISDLAITAVHASSTGGANSILLQALGNLFGFLTGGTGSAVNITDGAGNAADLSGAVTNPAGTLQIDTTTPTVVGISETPPNGDLNAGNVVTLTLSMSEAVTVAGGAPTLTLNDGGVATYAGGSGTNALTFSYTVAAGQNTADLMTNAVNLNGSNVTDGAGNAANLSLVGLAQGSPQIDTTAPTVSSVVTTGTGITSGAGDLAAGKVVTLTLNMSEAVTVSGGTPTLTLNDGGVATYAGGSGTSALTFSYTVGAGQNTSDLTVTAVNANAATITDGAGNAANLGGAVTNPAGTLQIDTTTPTVSSVVASGTGITSGSGDLNAGKVVTLTLNMSEAVTVSGGTPTLTLNDGGVATYTSGSGTSALTFSYTVGAGQNTSDLTVTAVNANAATIADGAGNAANLSGAVIGPSGTLQVDTTAPTVVGISETPPNGDLNAGKVVTLTLSMSEAVTVSGGTPTLTLNDGGVATYTGGSGSNALTFSYTVAAGQNTPDLMTTAVNLNAATITDGAGNAANLSLVGLAQGSPQIDTTAPTVSSVVASGAGINAGAGDLDAGSAVTLTLNLTEAVTVAGGTPTLTLNDGGVATYTGGSGTNVLTFSYTVGAGQNTSDLAITAVNANAATITDGAGNAANLSAAVTNPAGTLQIDTTTPTVSSVVATGTWVTAGSGYLNAGDVAILTVNLSEAVTVGGGTPTLTLTLNNGGVATYTGGSGTNALTFSYTVGAGQNTADLAISAVNANAATITDGAGNTADLSSAVTNPAGTLQIDTTTPPLTVSLANDTGISSSDGLTSNASLSGSGNPNALVTLSEGTITLGTTRADASGAWTFTPTGLSQGVQTIVATEINGGGRTKSEAITFTLDTTAPTVSSVVTTGTGITSGAGDLSAGKVVTLTLNLSEAVTVSGGTPTLTLNDGGVATYSGGSGTSALTFSYTVGAGQNTADLAVSAVNANTATITDGAGNAANLAGAVTNPAGTLQIDTTTPTVSSVVASGAGIAGGTGDLNAGKVVTLTLAMSEAVTVSGGTPTLTLNDGGVATYTGGSGTSALIFSYTVAAGQNTSDLAITAVNANAATITDGAGNAANLSGAVTTPTGTLQVDTIAPTVVGISETPPNGDLNAGKIVTLTLSMSEAVTVSGGTPTLTLNDGGVATYTGGSGSNALTFSYTVAAGQNTPDLMTTTVNLNGSNVTDGAGNAANLSLVGLAQGSPQIDTTAPTVSSVVASGAGITAGAGDLDAGSAVTLTLNLTEAVTVAGGTPTLTLNDGGVATYTGGSGTNVLTFSYTVGAGQNTSDLAVTAVNANAATVTDGAGNAANLSGAVTNPTGTLQIDTIAPTVSSVVASGTGITNGNGDLNAGSAVTLTLNLTEAVTVSGATPTLTLNDGGTATYTSGSGTNALTFSYMVGAGQNTADLAISAVNANAATITDGAGNTADLSSAVTNPAGTLQIDTTAPTVSSVVDSGTGISSGSGDLNAGKIATLTLNTSEAVTVSGGTPTLTLNDGGTATYTGGSGTNALTFSYTVAAGQNTSDLAISAINANAATITDGAGNAANLSGAVTNPTGNLQIDTTTPTVASVVASGNGITNGTGDLNAGDVVTLIVNLSEAVTVSGGTPTLTLNDGGVATYSGGSGTNALTFSYTVAAGQNTSALAITAANANTGATSILEAVLLSLSGRFIFGGGSGNSITDGAGNAANLSGAVTTPTGTLQIDTTTPTVSSVVASGTGITSGSGDLDAGSVVTLTFNLTEAVTVAGGTPTLTLNDGGVATYAGGSGTNALTFSYTVGAGQNTSDLAISAVNANAATITDGAGNAANLSGAVTKPAGILQIDTAAPAAPVFVNDTVNGNNITLNGTAAANSTITVYDGQAALGTTSVNGSGAWSYTTGTSNNGADTYYATATDAAGNTSAMSGFNSTGAPLSVNGTLEISQGNNSANVAFQAGNAGQLVLDKPAAYSGTISGFQAQDSIDLLGFSFDPNTTTLGYLPNSNQTGGTLSVTNGSQSASIALLGSYLASSFVTVGDGHGGSSVVAETSQGGNQSMLTNPQH